MKTIMKYRWPILAVWIAATVLLALWQPDINKIINEKGQGTVSEKYPSRIADKLLKGVDGADGNTALIVFTKTSKLTAGDMNGIESGIRLLKANEKKSRGYFLDVVSHLDNADTRGQMVSKDGTTVLAAVTYEKGVKETGAIKNDIDTILKNVNVQHYITGGDFIKEDFLAASMDGVDKSAVITVIFILLVLFLIFRSVVTPFVSLAAIGISYLCSMGIVSRMIYYWGFPVTSLTRMFIILVLFGIGTDYNILLFNRFKEELTVNGGTADVDTAIMNTYRTAGKTVLFCAMTVLIAFAGLIFAEFDVYRSGAAVAIGILILTAELFLLTPILMKFAGRRLFWPSHNKGEHRESRLWEIVTGIAVRHPVITIAVILAFMAPIIYFNHHKLSFDNIKETGPSYSSVKGFDAISDAFGKGKTLPTTIVIQNDAPMDNNSSLAVIDQLTDKVKAIDGVAGVSGPTQPKGAPIDAFYSYSQAETLADGLASAADGIDRIGGGLKQASEKIVSPDFSQVYELVKGTGEIYRNMTGISSALEQISAGTGKGAAGVSSISGNIGLIAKNLSMINDSLLKLQLGYTQIQSGYVSMQTNYRAMEQQLAGMKTVISGMGGMIGDIGKRFSGLASDKTFVTLGKTQKELAAGMDMIIAGMTRLNSEFDKANKGLGEADANLKTVSVGQSQAAGGLAQLKAGMDELAAGLDKSGKGQSALVSGMRKLTTGVADIKAGQEKMLAGLSDFGKGMAALKNGLDAGIDGLKPISAGLGKADKYLTQLSGTKSFFIPDEALKNNDFKKSLDAFMSSDRKTVRLVVTLKDDPYTSKAINTLDKIEQLVAGHMKGTVIAGAKLGIAGETSRTNDLGEVAVNDTTRMQIIVLAGVFIILLLIIRSFWTPVYIVASLVGAYYISMTITGYLAQHLLKADGMAWNVPFFSFVVIVALGVDYSIFLMMRYREYSGIRPREAIVKAARSVGGVVMSAAVILAGTFLTLFPSGVQTLMQLAISVSTGLLALILVMMPLALPSLVSLPAVFSGKDGGGNGKSAAG